MTILLLGTTELTSKRNAFIKFMSHEIKEEIPQRNWYEKQEI